LVVAGGTGGGIAAWNASNDPHWQQVSATSGAVHMDVDLEPASTGTALQLWLRGVEQGQRCRLIAISDSGDRDVAGSWEVSYSGRATIKGTTWIAREHLDRLVIRTYDGEQLVAADVPAV
jgi:hypothetical protein